MSRVKCTKLEKLGSTTTTTFVEDDEHDEPVIQIQIFVEEIRFVDIFQYVLGVRSWLAFFSRLEDSLYRHSERLAQ